MRRKSQFSILMIVSILKGGLAFKPSKQEKILISNKYPVKWQNDSIRQRLLMGLPINHTPLNFFINRTVIHSYFQSFCVEKKGIDQPLICLKIDLLVTAKEGRRMFLFLSFLFNNSRDINFNC